MKKKHLKDDLEMMANYAEALEIELKLSHDDNEDLNRRLGIANSTVHKQLKHIEMLDSQLLQQDRAIERKDRQFEGLKACYKDDLINGALG
jgi:hypothetical protein